MMANDLGYTQEAIGLLQNFPYGSCLLLIFVFSLVMREHSELVVLGLSISIRQTSARHITRGGGGISRIFPFLPS